MNPLMSFDKLSSLVKPPSQKFYSKKNHPSTEWNIELSLFCIIRSYISSNESSCGTLDNKLPTSKCICSLHLLVSRRLRFYQVVQVVGHIDISRGYLWKITYPKSSWDTCTLHILAKRYKIRRTISTKDCWGESRTISSIFSN